MLTPSRKRQTAQVSYVHAQSNVPGSPDKLTCRRNDVRACRGRDQWPPRPRHGATITPPTLNCCAEPGTFAGHGRVLDGFARPRSTTFPSSVSSLRTVNDNIHQERDIKHGSLECGGGEYIYASGGDIVVNRWDLARCGLRAREFGANRRIGTRPCGYCAACPNCASTLSIQPTRIGQRSADLISARHSIRQGHRRRYQRRVRATDPTSGHQWDDRSICGGVLLMACDAWMRTDRPVAAPRDRPQGHGRRSSSRSLPACAARGSSAMSSW